MTDEPPPPTPPPPASRSGTESAGRSRRRWPRRLGRAALVGAGLAALAFFTRSIWLGPLVESLGPSVARRLGYELEVASVEGDGLRELRLRGLRLAALAESTSPLRLVGARELDLELDLGPLLAGEGLGVASVTGSGVEVELTFADGAAEDDGEAAEDEPGDAFWLPLPEAQLTGSRLALEFEDFRVDVSGLDIEIPPLPSDGGERAPARVAATDASWRDANGDELASALVADVRLDAGGVDLVTLTLGEDTSGRDVRLAWAERDAFLWSGFFELGGGTVESSGAIEYAGGLETAFTLRSVQLAELGRFVPGGLDVTGLATDLSGELTLGPDGSLADLDGEVHVDLSRFSIGAAGPFECEGSVAFDGARIVSERLAISQAENRFLLTDVSLPVDGASLGETLRAGSAKVELEVTSIPALLTASLAPLERIERAEAEIPEHEIVLVASLESGVASIERGQLTTPGGRFDVQGGTIDARDGPPDVQLDLEASFDDLEPLGEILRSGEYRWSGELGGSVTLRGTWPAVTGEARLSGSAVALYGLALGDVELDLRYAESRLDIVRLDSRSPNGSLELTGGFDLDAQRLEDASFRLEVGELAEVVPWIDASGGVDVEGTVSGTLGDLRGSWALAANDVVLADRSLEYLSARGTLTHATVRIATLELGSDGVRVVTRASVELDSSLAPSSARIESLEIAREDSRLTLDEPVEVALTTRIPRIDGLSLSGESGSLSLFVREDDASPDEPAVAFGLEARDFDLSSLIRPFVPGGFGFSGLDARAEGRWSDRGLELTTSGEVASLDLPVVEADAPGEAAALGRSFRGSWDLSTREGRIVVQSLELSSELLGRVTLRGDAPIALPDPAAETIAVEALLPEGELSLDLKVDLPDLRAFEPLAPAGSAWPTGRLAGTAKLGGTWRRPTGTVELDAGSIALVADDEVVLDGASLVGRLRTGEETLVEDLRIEIPGSATLALSGRLARPFDVTRLLGGDELYPATTELELTTSVFVADSARLARVNRALGGDLVRRFGGRIAARLEVGGTLGAPSPSGSLELEGGELKLSPSLPAIERVAGVIRVEQGRWVVESLSGEMGAAPFAITGSVDREASAVDLELVGEDLLLYRAQGVKVRADAALHVTGSPERPLVGGALRLQDSRFVRRFDFLSVGGGQTIGSGKRELELFSFREPPLSRTRFDVRVTSERPFLIDNNIARVPLRPELTLAGTGETPELLGTIYIDEGKVTLPGSNLFLRSGTILFDRTEPMIPRLGLALANRVRGYDVNVSVTGPYDRPDLTLTSSPPLQSEDIVTLIVAGQDPGEGLSTKTGVAGAQAVGAFLAQDLITRLLSDDSTEAGESVADRIELYLGRDTTVEGGETIEVTYRLRDRVFGRDDTKLYLSAEQDEYAHYNFGVRFLFRFD